MSEISMSRPSVGEAGRTGDWRNSRPVMDAVKCLAVKQGKVTCQIFCKIEAPSTDAASYSSRGTLRRAAM